MKEKLLLALVIVAIPLSAEAAERAQSDADIYECCCRIYCDSSVAGSGTIFAQKEEGAYVLTNYHVAGTAKTIECHFMSTGHIVKVSAKRVWSAYNQNIPLDAAILLINKNDIEKVTDKFVPMNPNLKLESDATIVTCGAPSAKWVKLMHGSIYENKGCTFSFRPTPYGGQSGSSIIKYDTKGKPWIVGLLTWRSMDEGIDNPGGLAQPISTIFKAYYKEESSYSVGSSIPKDAVITPYNLKGSL